MNNEQCPNRKTILLISPYWKEDHRWMVSSVKLAELWQRIGYKVVVVCMSTVDNGKLIVDKESETLEIHKVQDVFLKDPWNYGIAFGFSGYVMKLVKDINPDHIVVNKLLFWTSLSIIRLRLSGHKVIAITDALVGMTWWPRSTFPKVCAALYAWTLGWLELLLASRVVFFHPQPTRLVSFLGIARKSQIIPTGIDSSLYKPTTNNQQPTTITYVGRLESIKGVDDFLEALVPLKEEYPAIKLQVVGHYEEGNALVEKFQRDVSFTGLRDDVSDILSQTDIFVMPSHSEGLSNAIMEAMSSGCACVVSEVGGNVFLVKNGVSGFCFPAGDREALRAHVKRLIDDPAKRKQLGEAACKRIEETFDWKVVGKQYQELFERS